MKASKVLRLEMFQRCVDCQQPLPVTPPGQTVLKFVGGKYRGEVCPGCTAKADAAGKLRRVPAA